MYSKMRRHRKDIGERITEQRRAYSKAIRINTECSKEEYQSPCKHNQVVIYFYFIYLFIAAMGMHQG
jgi:hypothetical protein